MQAIISYKIDNILHPWNKERRQSGGTAWCLVKVTKPEYGQTIEEPVAIFNLDSEAQTFQGHVFSEKLDGVLVSIHPDISRLFETI